MVLVNVVGSDVSKFFAYDGEYTIQKQSDGKYLLTHPTDTSGLAD